MAQMTAWLLFGQFFINTADFSVIIDHKLVKKRLNEIHKNIPMAQTAT